MTQHIYVSLTPLYLNNILCPYKHELSSLNCYIMFRILLSVCAEAVCNRNIQMYLLAVYC